MDKKNYSEDYKTLSKELINLKINYSKIKLNIMKRIKSDSLVLTGYAKDVIELCEDQIILLDNFESFFYVAYEVRRIQYNSTFKSLKDKVEMLETADDNSLFLDDDTPSFMKLRF